MSDDEALLRIEDSAMEILRVLRREEFLGSTHVKHQAKFILKTAFDLRKRRGDGDAAIEEHNAKALASLNAFTSAARRHGFK